MSKSDRKFIFKDKDDTETVAWTVDEYGDGADIEVHLNGARNNFYLGAHWSLESKRSADKVLEPFRVVIHTLEDAMSEFLKTVDKLSAKGLSKSDDYDSGWMESPPKKKKVVKSVATKKK